MAGGVSSTEVPFQPEAHWSVPWLLADRIARSGDRPLVARKSSLSGDWQEVSARAFGEEVAHVAAGLIGMGLEAGTAVGIMAHTSYDWFLLDMAIARAVLSRCPSTRRARLSRSSGSSPTPMCVWSSPRAARWPSSYAAPSPVSSSR